MSTQEEEKHDQNNIMKNEDTVLKTTVASHEKPNPNDSVYQMYENFPAIQQQQLKLQQQEQSSKISLLAKPLFNIIVSAFFTIALLLVFLHADGKSLDYSIIGLKIPSLISLILNVNGLFITSGLSTAIGEYKWVRLKNGSKLSIVDIYDSCTKGLSGLAAIAKGLHFDHILVLALIFHAGLVAVSPLSQEILVPYIKNYTMSGIDTRFFYFKPYDINGRSGLQQTGMPPKMNGLTNNAYITTSSFAQAATGSRSAPLYTCPSKATQCEFKNVSFISTAMTCTNIGENDTAIANRGGTIPTIVVLKEYFTNLNISYAGKTKYFPMFLYAPEMFGRTYYDLLNYTAPIMPGLNITSIFADKYIYDPQYRPYVGDQRFIMAYNKANLYSRIANNYTEMGFKKCSFTSSLNTSTWRTVNGTLEKMNNDTSVPIVMDYDRVLGNNTALHSDALTDHPNWAIMVNAYIMQQSLLIELITSKYYGIYDYLGAWRQDRITSISDILNNNHTNDPTFEDFMKDALRAFDYAYFQAPFVTRNYGDLNTQYNGGEAFFSSDPIYRVKQEASYLLSLCLFLPIIWWVLVWASSMRQMGGVARGSSQVALLATRLTPLAEDRLRHFSRLDSGRAFDLAKDIRVRVGTFVRDNQEQHVALGLEGEDRLHPLKNI
ncbi:MAG: hypothetical protein EXX96DRAFT_580403 [Benjaminiella poitrasii]|nr:MAG: hypothetical protein EXX96DRAFT_580403 [Benjaminiella poitrasii]